MACVLQREEKVEINGKAEKERKAMLAMRHYLKESDRQGIEFDKTNFAHSQHSACQRT